MAFKLTSKGVETVLHNFGVRPSDGLNPAYNLIQDNKGNLYGVTPNVVTMMPLLASAQIGSNGLVRRCRSNFEPVTHLFLPVSASCNELAQIQEPSSFTIRLQRWHCS